MNRELGLMYWKCEEYNIDVISITKSKSIFEAFDIINGNRWEVDITIFNINDLTYTNVMEFVCYLNRHKLLSKLIVESYDVGKVLELTNDINNSLIAVTKE